MQSAERNKFRMVHDLLVTIIISKHHIQVITVLSDANTSAIVSLSKEAVVLMT